MLHLVNVMKRLGTRRGIATECIGGGQGGAMLVEMAVIMNSKIMDVLGDRVLELGPKYEADSLYRNFKLTRDADGIAWLLFDRAGASANTLSSDIIEEFDTVLATLESQRPVGLVIRSAKTSGFIAGADVNERRDRFSSVASLSVAHMR